jgi:hypothetical protein
MPTITEAPVRAYCHCRDARCPGYQQQEIDAVREEASYTFGENGGDGVFTHMVESSRVEYRAADEADVACPVCSADREVTGTPRPQYVNESGFDPMGLLSVPKFDAHPDSVPAGVRGETDDEIEARLRAKLREEAIEARLRAELAD